MADMETMLNWAEYDSAYSLIKDKLSEEDLLEFLWECVSQDDAYDMVHEICHNMGFIDYEQVKADYEDQKYQEWKERGLDD